MTIDEAISHAREVAEREYAECRFCADEHEQLAEWLEELKAIKEGAVFYSNRPIEDIVIEARNDAIDEFLGSINKIDRFWFADKDKNLITPKMVDYEEIQKIAGQLKEQNK